MREQLEKHVSTHFVLLGNLPQQDIAALLKEANVLCLPSRSEGFATVLLEAAACFTPAITTDIGGVDELIPSNEYGTIIAQRDADSLFTELHKAMHNRNILHQKGLKAGALARQQYSWENTAQKVLEACTKSKKPTKRQ